MIQPVSSPGMLVSTRPHSATSKQTTAFILVAVNPEISPRNIKVTATHMRLAEISLTTRVL
jgi:hypothetical protein